MARGDHIAVKRHGGLYKHHGIDLGDGHVIHFSGEPLNSKTPIVEKVAMEEFLKDGELEVVRYSSNKKPFSAEETIQRAEKRLGEGRYNLLCNNCEHFASWCKNGKARSTQVTKLLWAAGSIAVVGVVALILYQATSESENNTGREG